MPPESAPLADAPPPAPEAPVIPGDADILAQLEGKPATPAEAPAAAEKPKDPEPETPRESALLRSVQQRERRMQAERERDRQERATWERSFEERLQRGIEAGLKQRLADPRVALKALGEAGHADQAIADALLHKDTQSPEELARAAIARADALEKRYSEQQAAAARAENERVYTTLAKELDAKGELPHLFSEWTEPELVAETYRFVAELRDECARSGRSMPTGNIDRQILRVLDNRAKARQDARDGRRKAKGADDTTKAAPQGDTKADANGSGHQGKQPGASATTTLGKSLGERMTMPSSDPALMSDEDIIARANELVSKGLAPKAR